MLCKHPHIKKEKKLDILQNKHAAMRFVVVAGILVFLFVSFLRQPRVTEATISVALSASESARQQSVEYFLPYPGLLPNHPLYVLKVTRDALIGILITDLVKKAEFNLLQADKRLHAAVLLMNEKSDSGLIVSTVSKGENYFEQAIAKVSEAQEQNKSAHWLLVTMRNAAKKHQEVIKKLESSIDTNFVQQLRHERERVEQFEKTVTALIENS